MPKAHGDPQMARYMGASSKQGIALWLLGQAKPRDL